MIHKNAPRADLTRAEDGSASWSVERPAAWGAHLASGGALAPEDVVTIEGIRFWFAVLEPDKVPPLALSVVNGELYVRPFAT